jgi:hypothetical protein
MEMNSPVGPNALDTQGIVGKPINRVDGRLKVTGGARYAYEMQYRSIHALPRKRRGSHWFSPIATHRRRGAAITVRRTRCSPARK